MLCRNFSGFTVNHCPPSLPIEDLFEGSAHNGKCNNTALHLPAVALHFTEVAARNVMTATENHCLVHYRQTQLVRVDGADIRK
jgi:hypothetical protein